MSLIRAFSAALPFVIAAAACGPDPVGVNACRSIEDASCEAAPACGINTSVNECKRFYRDQCLHGLKTKDAPSSSDVKQCVAAIRAAGDCAKNNQTLAQCSGASSAVPGAKLKNVCDVVLTPEKTLACSFLQPTAIDAGADTGTASGSDAASDADTDGGG